MRALHRNSLFISVPRSRPQNVEASRCTAALPTIIILVLQFHGVVKSAFVELFTTLWCFYNGAGRKCSTSLPPPYTLPLCALRGATDLSWTLSMKTKRALKFCVWDTILALAPHLNSPCRISIFFWFFALFNFIKIKNIADKTFTGHKRSNQWPRLLTAI
jgi:hypothetical protein